MLNQLRNRSEFDLELCDCDTSFQWAVWSL